jgi:hypothetical protein
MVKQPNKILRAVLGWMVACSALFAGTPLEAQIPDITARSPIDPETAPRPYARALPAPAEIVIDGQLDERAWHEIPPITDFVQAQPDEGLAASEATAVRIMYDATHLYVGAVCYDTDPGAVVVKSLERDYPGVLSENMDTFGVTLDTFFDRRNSFIFFVNPRGGLKDGQGFDNGRSRDYGWDGVIEVKTTVHDSGWTVEMAIPWKTLRFDPTLDGQTWGMNLLRRIRRKNEVSYWAPLDRRDRFFRMSQAGTVAGLPRLSAGRNLRVKPFALAARSTGDSLLEDDRGNEFDGGVDLKYGITPRLTMDLTYRTDFSQVEVDREQVNLTRFALFFPERREFFLENSGTFTFGDVNSGPGSPRSGTSLRDFTLFHSREIGLKSGRPIPLFGGARVTGRAGAFELGFLDVQSEAFEGDPAENLAVARLRRSVFGNSDVGFIFTNRQATGSGAAGQYNRSFGADANLRFLGGLFLNTYFAATRASEAKDEAARLAVGWRDRLWNALAQFRYVGDTFDPGIGFVRRRGIHHGYATLGAHPRPDLSQILEVNPYVEGHYITNLDGVLETRTGRVGLGITFQDGGRFSVQYTDRFERLDEPFRVRSEATVPVGDYHFREGSVSYSSSQGRSLSGNVGISGGDFFDGDRFTISGGARWQPDYHVTLDVEATHNDLSVQGSSFTADLYSARLKYAYSTSLYFGAFVQYNADVDEVVTNVRVNFIHAPLSDFFLVFTERRDVSSGGVGVLQRFVTAKVTKLLAF